MKSIADHMTARPEGRDRWMNYDWSTEDIVPYGYWHRILDRVLLPIRTQLYAMMGEEQ